MKPLTVLTFNAGLLDVNLIGLSLFKPAAFIEERVRAIIETLKGYPADIVALQEVYLRKHHQFFMTELVQSFPYKAFSEMPILNWGSGLMTFSKYPIVEGRFTPFTEGGTLDETIFAKRGILTAEIIINKRLKLSVFNIHLTSGGIFYHMEHTLVQQKRSKQIKQVVNMIDQLEVKNVIMLGDFNSGPSVSSLNYDEILKYGFMDIYDEFCRSTKSQKENTWDVANPLHISKPSVGSHRIDHIFIKKCTLDILNTQVVFKEAIVQIGSNKKKMVTLSDHYGLEATLSF